MADVIIEASAKTVLYRLSDNRWVAEKDKDTIYAFHINGSNALEYRKSADGGATWAAATSIHTGNVVKFSIWFDKWTSGDTGTKVHIALVDAGGAPDTISYYNLDIATDTLSSEVEAATPNVSGTNNYGNSYISVAKAKGGNLLLQYWGTSGGSHGCLRSTDGGANWTSRADGADGNEVDFVLMFPGNEADNQDMWMVYWDKSADEISLKTYDDSANSWAETSIQTSMVDGDINYLQMAGAIRHSDNHLILAAWSELDAATADLRTWDINGSGSITAKTDVISNAVEAAQCCVTINQQNDGIYVGYIKGTTWESIVDVFYKLSPDGAASWGSETAMSADTNDDRRALSSVMSIDDDGGIFLPFWFNDDTNNLMCNTDNAVTINAAASAAAKRRRVGFGAGWAARR